MKVVTYTDGGARGNPGPSAVGVIIKDAKGKLLKAFGKYIGEGTNNTAEYTALIYALSLARELGAKEVECRMDSLLVSEQMNRRWKIKEPHLQKLFVKAWNAAAQFKKISFKHVPREQNKEPDKLLNQVLDKQLQNKTAF